jgi:hypothetical protein
MKEETKEGEKQLTGPYYALQVANTHLEKKINSTMTSTINIQSFDSEILYNSEESVVPNPGSNSFLNDVLEKVFEEEKDEL